MMTHYIARAMGIDALDYALPLVGNLPRFGPSLPPTHYTTGAGGTYSARPDLTRPGFGQALFAIAMSPAGMTTMAVTASVAAYYAETKNIQNIAGSQNVDTATKIHMLQGLTPY
jgi:hypothetical protein